MNKKQANNVAKKKKEKERELKKKSIEFFEFRSIKTDTTTIRIMSLPGTSSFIKSAQEIRVTIYKRLGFHIFSI